MREVSTATHLQTLTQHLKHRKWPEPTKFRNPPWLAAFADCTSQSLQQRCSTNETLKTLRVEAQVKERDGDYHGDEDRRRDVAVKLSTILSLLAARGDSKHWLREATDGAEYYLAQAPLYAITSEGNETRHALADLVLSSKGSPMPPWLRGAATLNLWLSPGETSSAPHCDESHNVLTVLSGRKTVLLLPPSSGADLGALPAWSASPHHCQCSSEDAARHPAACTVVVDVGEALLIPAGWFHAVASPAGTVAVNCWWPPSLMCRSQKALAALAFRKGQGPQVAFFARRALIRRQRAAVNKAAGELKLADLLKAAAADLARWRAAVARAGPATCAALYALWTREADGACDELLEVFAPEERGAVVSRLRRGRDKFARAVFRKLCRRLRRRSRRRVCSCCNFVRTPLHALPGLPRLENKRERVAY